jgi:hypothetical protein
MGIRANVYSRNGADTTNGGVTSRVDSVVIVNAEGPFEPSEDSPAVRIAEKTVFGKTVTYAVPVETPDGKRGPMFGGNFIYSSDKRFPSDDPIKVHDRFEDY